MHRAIFLLFLASITPRAGAALPSTIYIYDLSRSDRAQREMMASVAGVVNREAPGTLLLSAPGDELPNPRFWLAQLRLANPKIATESFDDPLVELRRNAKLFKGYVLYDRTQPDSINAATSIAGVTDSMIVDASTLKFAEAINLPRTADARVMSAGDAYAKYGEQFSRKYMFNQAPSFEHQLRDVAVMVRGFMAYHPPEMNKHLARQEPHSLLVGWGKSEVGIFEIASQNSLQMVAADHLPSGSTTAGWEVPFVPQKTHVEAERTTLTNKHLVAFLMCDGDNVQWLAQDFASPKRGWFGSPHRGKFSMSWEVSPSMRQLNPVALRYFHEQASAGKAKDFFVTPSGAGTNFPSIYPADGLAKSISDSMAAADQNVLSVLDTKYDPAKLRRMLEEKQIIGIVYKTYDQAYKARQGAIEWHNGKPIISVKYTLWDGFDSNDALVAALNAAPRDPVHDEKSYSVVNVHPWSNGAKGDPMSNVADVVTRLDDGVAVVTLEELICDLRAHHGVARR